MPRTTYYYDKETGTFHTHRSNEPAAKVHVIEDSMPPMMGHHDCKIYTSKREYERSVRAAGLEIRGNELEGKEISFPSYKPEGIKEALLKSWERLGGR